MGRRLLAAAAALPALAGCDRLMAPFAGSGDPAATAAANQAGTGGKDPAAGAPAAPVQAGDAGITTSRSLAGLTGAGAGTGGTGGKDPAAGGAIRPAMLVGSWGDEGDCGRAVDFHSDGSFRTFDGNGGAWRLDGDRLIMTGNGRSLIVQLRSVDREAMVGVNEQGEEGRSIRC